ncbi:DUF3429 domain-containing protein [Arsenicitalea aurantiaca]|uniref:DUF3429 domain-containing protein n=1 Tax=Arsenicitalea aurantiaca TaxID=1783274 RepID=A0A433X3B9_9HYPH|nr:DUF3429 domain-containing protein [Arsenicitalea aurantiaca]RUT28550.1 DUF3429 domain-containing protein [Arsenicitalea aurantiaca]
MTDAPSPTMPMASRQTIALILTAAGALPFLAGLVDVALLGGQWLQAIQVYGAVIAAFICGIHWGAAMFAPERMAPRLLILSNFLALLAWLSALLPPTAGFLSLAAVFGSLLLVDRHLFRAGLWPDWFWTLRIAISALVIGVTLLLGILA